MPKVNPAILVWARETAGLTEEEAVDKLNIRDARGVAGIDRLRRLEAGEDTPTRPLLVKMAKRYHRPLLAFYLAEPPRQGNRGQDFRSLAHGERPEDEPLLDALIRDVLARQSLIRSALLDEEEPEPLRFIGSITSDLTVESAVSAIRDTVDLSVAALRRASNVDDAFALLRDKTEEAGVFVLLVGDLGSHHTAIDLETFRGFALADDIAPFLIINDQDHHAAWSFTLLHELTHLFLGQTGVSGGSPGNEVERFCNDVASEFLLPDRDLTELPDLSLIGVEEAARRISDFASARNLSRSMVAYRAFRTRRLTRDGWLTLSTHFRDRWFAERERQRVRSRQTEGGPSYYVVRRHRLGDALVGTTARLMATGSLTTSKAGTVLGVKPKNVGRLISEYREGGS